MMNWNFNLGLKLITTKEYERLQIPLVVEKLVIRSPNSSKESELLPLVTRERIKETELKYPSAIVKYAGTPKAKSSATFSIDVRNYALAGQNDSDLTTLVENNKATVAQVQGNLNYHEKCDVVVAKINQLTKVNYQLDSENYGFSEYWQIAPLTLKIGKMDCDDMAILRYVLCRIAGVPAELLRIGVGIAKMGGGHATNYYLASNLEWLHLNSTTTFDLPDETVYKQTLRDPTLAIQDFWFSFNELNAWSKIESKETLNKLPPKFEIRNT